MDLSKLCWQTRLSTRKKTQPPFYVTDKSYFDGILYICRWIDKESNTQSHWEVLCLQQPAVVTPQYWPPPTQPTRFLTTFLNNFIIHTEKYTMTEHAFYSHNTLVAVCRKHLQGEATFAIKLYCTKVLLLQPIGQRQFNFLLQEVNYKK